MSAHLEVCWCGHHKDTHHPDLVQYDLLGKDGEYHPLITPGQCLGMGCNVPSDDWEEQGVTDMCPFYRDRRYPDPWQAEKLRIERPDHIDTCECYRCRQATGLA